MLFLSPNSFIDRTQSSLLQISGGRLYWPDIRQLAESGQCRNGLRHGEICGRGKSSGWRAESMSCAFVGACNMTTVRAGPRERQISDENGPERAFSADGERKNGFGGLNIVLRGHEPAKIDENEAHLARNGQKQPGNGRKQRNLPPMRNGDEIETSGLIRAHPCHPWVKIPEF